MAIPCSVLADDPPVTWSVESLKLEVNKVEMVAPEPDVLSSLMLDRVDEPLAMGASLTAVMLVLSVTTPVE